MLWVGCGKHGKPREASQNSSLVLALITRAYAHTDQHLAGFILTIAMKSNEIEFDAMGCMVYHPDYHPNQGRDWTTVDQRFLIDNYERVGPEEVSLALGRTIHAVMNRACMLRKQGLMAKPKKKTHFTRQIRRSTC